mgnify:CR=1 FL=1
MRLTDIAKAGPFSAGPRRAAALTVSACLAFGFLYLLSRYSYLLFHGVAEVFSVLIAFSIFIIAWNTRDLVANHYLLFLGIAYLFVGGIDLVHTLAYKGMGVFQGYQANLPTQLWIAARYLESLSLLAAPLFLRRRLKAAYAFAAYAAICLLIYLSIFVWDIFPTCFVEGAGLTPFKKASEYLICGILLAALAYLGRERESLDRGVFHMLAASILVTAASELSFTLYVDPYGLFNQLGHFLKIVSFYLIYRAVVVTALREPHGLLFRELKGSEERYRALADTLPQVVFEMDASGRVTYVNEVAYAMFGYDREEISRGLNILEVVHPSDRERVLHAVATILDGRSLGDTREYLARRKDGTTFPCVVYSAAITGEDGAPVGIRGILTDISERKRMEEEIIRANRELELYADVVSHDLRGPVSVIRSAVATMEGLIEDCGDRDTAAAGAKVLDILRHSSDAARALIEDLLDLAKAGQVPEKVKLVDVGGVVERILEERSLLMGEKGVAVTRDQDLGRVVADPTHIYQIFSNLIANAVAYNDSPRPEIAIAHREEAGLHRYLVRDNGPGIPEEELEDVFLPLHRSESGGTGLGLSIVHRLVALYGGTIRAYNDGGACFEFTLRDHEPRSWQAYPGE